MTARTPAERLAADLLPYSHTHVNHPCALLVRASRANFDSTIELVKRHRNEARVSDGPLTPYALAMPEKYQYGVRDQKYLVELTTSTMLNSAVAAYRAYYRTEKRGHWRRSRDPAKPSTWVPAKWTRRDPPEWF